MRGGRLCGKNGKREKKRVGWLGSRKERGEMREKRKKIKNKNKIDIIIIIIIK